MSNLSPFGEKLRGWRKQRGMSQLDLALCADTTPRYVSFIETGRSRPGRDLVLRIVEALEVPLRDQNTLLRAAGLPAAHPQHSLDDAELAPVRQIITQVLDNHDPYPGMALGPGFSVLQLNESAERLFQDIRDLSPDDIIARWFKDQALQETAIDSPVFTPIVHFGDRCIQTITTAMRFDKARDITTSELVVELMFPADAEADAFFRDAFETSGASRRPRGRRDGDHRPETGGQHR